MDAKHGTTDQSTVGKPQMNAVRDPLVRQLSDLLYAVGSELMTASRQVERRQVDDYPSQGLMIGEAMQRIILLHGQLASLDELEGGRMHGKARPEFPVQDPAITARLAEFNARRAARDELEQTQQRPRPIVAVDDSELPYTD
jgi:hypothetical protein